MAARVYRVCPRFCFLGYSVTFRPMKMMLRISLLVLVVFYAGCKSGEKKDWKYEVCQAIVTSGLSAVHNEQLSLKGHPVRIQISGVIEAIGDSILRNTSSGSILFSKGLIKRINIENGEDGNLSMVCEYDEKNRLAVVEQPSIQNKVTFTYDDAGRCLTRLQTDNGAHTELTTYQYFPGNDSLYIIHGARGTEKLYLEASDSVMTVNSRWEDKGTVLSEKRLVFNRKAQLIETDFFRDAKLFRKRTYQLDEHGQVLLNLQEVEAAHESEKLLKDKNASTRYEYLYDAQGNVTQKKGVQLDSSFTLLETREISY